MKQIKSVVLFYNSKRRKALAYAAAIERRLVAAGAKVQRVCVNDAACEVKKADAAVAVGGDGTVLHLASLFEKDEPLPPVISFAKDSETVERQATIDLEAGQRYELRMECVLRDGAKPVSLSWSCPFLPKQIVPTDCLFTTPAPKVKP